MDERESRAYLVALRAKVDEHFAQASATQPDAFSCTKGCSKCCEQRFSVFELEATHIRDALRRLETEAPAARERIRGQADDPDFAGVCPLLVDGSCSVYDERPIICRTHGLPSARSDGSIDVCPLNFTTQTPHPRSLLVIDRINQPLALMASMHPGGEQRVELEALARGESSSPEH